MKQTNERKGYWRGLNYVYGKFPNRSHNYSVGLNFG